MYKVFVNDKILKISEQIINNTDIKVEYINHNQLLKIILDLEKGKYNSINIITPCTKCVIDDFNKIADIRIAAGGKVTNTENEILFILRDNVWDLPKGFIEPGESTENAAIREIEEETGVTNIEISNYLKTTYHTYRYKGNLVLKISKWFNMKSNYKGNFKPQKEEGITEVKWIKNNDIDKVLQSTWNNIKLLF